MGASQEIFEELARHKEFSAHHESGRQGFENRLEITDLETMIQLDELAEKFDSSPEYSQNQPFLTQKQMTQANKER